MPEYKFATGALHLSGYLLDLLVQHCLAEAPFEACGVLSGSPGGWPQQWHPMVNALGSRVAYSFDRQAQLDLYRDLDAAGRVPLVVYHSHVNGIAVPSTTDELMAHDPTILHLIVALERVVAASVSGRSLVQSSAVRAWRIGGVSTEIPIQLDTPVDT